MPSNVASEHSFLPMEVHAWGQRHAQTLELIATRFVATGEWPEVATLTRDLARQGQALPLSSVLESLPRPLGFLEGYPRRAVLLVFGLALTQAGQPLLRGFGTTLRLALDRFQGPDPEPIIRESDVRSVLGGDGPLVRALTEVLQREAPFLQGGTRPIDQEWFAHVSEDVVRYWNARDVPDYLTTRAAELFAAELPGWPPSPTDLGPPTVELEPAAEAQGEVRDVFISHASEDKDVVARPLTHLLQALGHSVWLDEQELVVGDSLSASIDRGLASSRFGVVILSQSFFAKPWTKRELAGLVARETIHDDSVILPIWHDVDASDVLAFSPPLAERYAASTRDGLDSVAQKVSTAIKRRGPGPVRPATSNELPAVPRTPPTLQEILSVALTPPGSPSHWSIYDGVALLRIVAAATPTGQRHPAAADPRMLLTDASASASEVARQWPERASLLLHEISDDWQPTASHVWGAGHVSDEPERLRTRYGAATAFSTRTNVLTIDRTWPTAVEDEHGRLVYHAAREPEIAAELLVALRLAALLLEPLPGLEAIDVAILFAAAPTDAALVSSERAVSGRRFGEPVARISPLANVPPRHTDHGRFALAELLDPYSAAQQLLGPWLATFRNEDLFARLKNG